MIHAEIKQKLIDDMNKLPMELQKKVQDFAHALLLTQTKGTSGKDLLKYAGILDDADANEMVSAIEGGCEKVDVNEW